MIKVRLAQSGLKCRTPCGRSAERKPDDLRAKQVIAGAAFAPFTIVHGPTSYNLEREVLGWDMHDRGFLMGTIPPLLVGAGLWSLRALIACGLRAAFRALTVTCVGMLLFAAMNLAFRAMGPPLDLFLLAHAGVVAALTTPRRGSIRVVLGLLAMPTAPPWSW